MGENGIDINGLDKAELLKALYDNATVIGMGGLTARQGEMTIEDAKEIIGRVKDLYFDYLGGRVMKIDLNGDTVDGRLYDRDNGDGMTEHIVNKLRGVTSDNPQTGMFRRERCQHDPMLLLGIALGNDASPCDGCNMDRSPCNGGPHKGR